MYIHETEQLIPACWDKALFHPAAGFRDQRTASGEFVGWVVQGHFEEDGETHLVDVTWNFTPGVIWLHIKDNL